MTRNRPSWSGDLPDQPDRPQPTARITYQRPNGDRRHLRADPTPDGIANALGSIRHAGNQIVKTVLIDENGDEWTYEYSIAGEVERIFRNGEVIP